MTKQGLGGGTVKAKCRHCLYTKQCHKVSGKLYPPDGGYLCEDCLIPAAVEAQKAAAAKPPPPPKDTRPHIICPECHHKSYDPQDILLKYCPRCEWFTSEPSMRNVPKSQRGTSSA